MSSSQALFHLHLQVELNEKYATLTFPQREIHEYGAGHNSLGNSANLKAVQQAVHPNLTDQHFVRPFNDHDEKSEIRHLAFTTFESAFASMSHSAFATHKAVLLRPDDFHLLIIQGFARFLQQYPEDFRSSVVTFTGKTQITIAGIDPTEMDNWEHLPKGFAGLIKSYLAYPELADALLQTYSDSTHADAIAKAATLMGTFSAYFSYLTATACYIPRFILQGTVEDWDKLANLPKQILSTLPPSAKNQPAGLTLLYRWLERLQPILDKMQAARRGAMDPAFWNSFYQFHSQSGVNTISGNFVYFYPFLKDIQYHSGNSNHQEKNFAERLKINHFILGDSITLGHYHQFHTRGPTSLDLPANIINVDFKLRTTDEHGQSVDYDMGIKAGIVTFKESVLSEQRGSALRTHVDYSIFYKSKLPPRNYRPIEKTSVETDSTAKPVTAQENTAAAAASTQASNPHTVFKKKTFRFEIEADVPEENSSKPLAK